MTIFALRSFMSSTIQFESHALPAIKPANLMSSIGVRRHRCHAGVLPVTWRRDEPHQIPKSIGRARILVVQPPFDLPMA